MARCSAAVVQREDAFDLHHRDNAITATNPADNGTAGGLAPGAPGTKPVANYTIVGTVAPRHHIRRSRPARPRMSNIRVPGMLHGRVGALAVRPPTAPGTLRAASFDPIFGVTYPGRPGAAPGQTSSAL